MAGVVHSGRGCAVVVQTIRKMEPPLERRKRKDLEMRGPSTGREVEMIS